MFDAFSISVKILVHFSMTVFFFSAEEVDNLENEVGRKMKNAGSLSLKNGNF